jgi:hypothetical protein
LPSAAWAVTATLAAAIIVETKSPLTKVLLLIFIFLTPLVVDRAGPPDLMTLCFLQKLQSVPQNLKFLSEHDRYFAIKYYLSTNKYYLIIKS